MYLICSKCQDKSWISFGHDEGSRIIYIAALVIPVPARQEAAYRRWVETSAHIFKDYGCLEVIDGWEDNVPLGRQTDFRRAVAAMEGEKIAVSYQIWPSREALAEAEERMHADGVLDSAGAPPFDAGRLIVGCFAPIGGTDSGE